jgi:DNA modification methylase
LQIETRPLDALRPSPTNARKHSPSQLDQIARSIREWGWTMPALIDEDGTILAGHGRVQAAIRMGLTEAKVVVATGWSEAKKRAYVIADNRLAQTTWDREKLASELAELGAVFGIDLTLLGFGTAEIGRILDRNRQAATEDELPEPPKKPTTKPGDLWRLGDHLLLCGSATSGTDVPRLMAAAGGHPALMVTDPPYGVDYDPEWRNRAGVSSTARTGKVTNDDRVDWREAWALFPGTVAYVWHAGRLGAQVVESLEAAGFKLRAHIVWAKRRLVLGRGDYHWQHEPCFYAVRGKAHWQGARDQTTVWEVGGGEGDEATVHGTQKPVEVMRRPMLNNSGRGDLVYDPFIGSGTAIIAAETVERGCLGIELEPAYCDMAIERWKKFTGGKPCRESSSKVPTRGKSKGT